MHESHNSLQRLAILNIAISLWERPDVKSKVKEFFILCARERSRESRMLSKWYDLTKEVLQQLERDVLPAILYRELLHVSKEIGKKIYGWYWRIERENMVQYGKVGQALEYVDQIYWTQQGTVDAVRIIQSSWIGNANLSVSTIYNFACKYALEECINSLWTQIPQATQDRDYGDIYRYYTRHILAYWQCLRNDEMTELIWRFERYSYGKLGYSVLFNNSFHYLYNPHHSIEENMCRLSMFAGYSNAVKYFWNKLNNEERDRNIVSGTRILIQQYAYYKYERHYTKERYVEICVFLMSKMAVHHQEELFNKKIITLIDDSFEKSIQYCIVEMLLFTWPWQEFLMPTLDKIWLYLENDTSIVYGILQAITSKMSQDCALGFVIEDSQYRSILHQVWNRIPVKIKRKIALDHSDNSLVALMHDLFDIWDLSSIKLVVSAQEMAPRKKELIDSGSKKYAELIKEDQYELLDQFIDQILVSEEEKKSFKKGIDILDDLIKCDQYYLADKLLNWQCSANEEKGILKSKVDNIALIRGFIISSKYELVDKFLSWRFSTEEERKVCKKTVQEDKCVREHIYKLWAAQKKDVSAALENSNKFLYWLLASEEEITSFKQDYLSNNEELEAALCDTFIGYNAFEVIEDFLTWCMLPQEVIHTLKCKVVGKTLLQNCERCIERGLLDDAEQFVRWAFDHEAEMKGFIREFIMSDNGIASCNTFIRLEERVEKFNEFINFWIKPLGNIDEFKGKLRFYRHNHHEEDDYFYIRHIENYTIFENLLDNLKQSLDVSEVSYVRNVAKKMKRDVEVSHIR